MSTLFAQHGLVSVVPCLLMCSSANMFSLMADSLRNRKIVTTTVVRKVSTSIGRQILLLLVRHIMRIYLIF